MTHEFHPPLFFAGGTLERFVASPSVFCIDFPHSIQDTTPIVLHLHQLKEGLENYVLDFLRILGSRPGGGRSLAVGGCLCVGCRFNAGFMLV